MRGDYTIAFNFRLDQVAHRSEAESRAAARIVGQEPLAEEPEGVDGIPEALERLRAFDYKFATPRGRGGWGLGIQLLQNYSKSPGDEEKGKRAEDVSPLLLVFSW